MSAPSQPGPPFLFGASAEAKEQSRRDTSLRVDWNPVAGATGYDLLVNGATIPDQVGGAVVSGLTANSLQHVAVRAKNGDGASAFSASFDVWTRPPVPLPPAFDTPFDAARGPDFLRLAIGGVAAGPAIDLLIDDATVVSDATNPATVGARTPNTKYAVAARQRDDARGGPSFWSAAAEFVTRPPTPPDFQRLPAEIGARDVCLTWGAVAAFPNSAGAKVEISRSVAGAAGAGIIFSAPSLAAGAFRDTLLLPGCVNEYRIRTVANHPSLGANESFFSAVVHVLDLLANHPGPGGSTGIAHDAAVRTLSLHYSMLAAEVDAGGECGAGGDNDGGADCGGDGGGGDDGGGDDGGGDDAGGDDAGGDDDGGGDDGGWDGSDDGDDDGWGGDDGPDDFGNDFGNDGDGPSVSGLEGCSPSEVDKINQAVQDTGGFGSYISGGNPDCNPRFSSGPSNYSPDTVTPGGLSGGEEGTYDGSPDAGDDVDGVGGEGTDGDEHGTISMEIHAPGPRPEREPWDRPERDRPGGYGGGGGDGGGGGGGGGSSGGTAPQGGGGASGGQSPGGSLGNGSTQFSETADAVISRLPGALQLAAGTLEAIGAAGMLLTPGPTQIAGLALGMHAVDTLQAAFNSLATGQPTATETQKLAQSLATQAGASPGTAAGIGVAADLLAGIGPGLGVGLAKGFAVKAEESLVHLTTAERAAAINASDVLVSGTGNYAGPASNASATGLEITLRTGISPANNAAVQIPQAANAAFSTPVTIGPITAWQAGTGQAFTVPGSLNLITGEFIQSGFNFNQAKFYGLDAVFTAVRGMNDWEAAPAGSPRPNESNDR